MASFLPPVHTGQLFVGTGLLLMCKHWLPYQTQNFADLSRSLLASEWHPKPVSCLPGCSVWEWSGSVWVVWCIFHFLMMDFTVLRGIISAFEIFLYPSPALCLSTTLSLTCFESSLVFMVALLDHYVSCSLKVFIYLREIIYKLNHFEYTQAETISLILWPFKQIICT